MSRWGAAGNATPAWLHVDAVTEKTLQKTPNLSRVTYVGVCFHSKEALRHASPDWSTLTLCTGLTGRTTEVAYMLDLYWKPLRKQDISDRREQDKQVKRDENGKVIETLLRSIVKGVMVSGCTCVRA